MRQHTLFRLCVPLLIYFSPLLANASVQSSLENVQDVLVGRIAPLAAILGFVFAGFSYITGNPNARSHLILAIIGACVCFGASSIVSFIQSMVR